MRVRAFSWLSVSLVVLAGCARQPGVDVEAEQAVLLATDTAWAESGADLEQHMAAFADDATLLPSEMPRISGKAAIRKAWGEMVRLPGFSLSWVPERAVVAASGDLGYTMGSDEFSLANAEGVKTTTKGKYVTIWRKQADRSWKVVVDIGNSDAPPEPIAPPQR